MREAFVRQEHAQATGPLNGGPKTHFAQPADDVLVVRNAVNFRILPNAYRKSQGVLGKSDKARPNVFWAERCDVDTINQDATSRDVDELEERVR